MLAVAFTLLLSAGNGDGDPAWQQALFDKAVNECALEALVREARNGGLAMDKDSGQGKVADLIFERCRKELGSQQEK